MSQKNRFFGIASILMVLLIELVKQGNFDINPWISTQFLTAYQFGFRSRFVISSIAFLMTPYITEHFIFTFIVVSVLLFCGLVSILLSQVIWTAEQKIRTAIIILVGVYLASPGSISFLFNYSNLGRLDTYLILLTLVMIVLIAKSWMIFQIPFLCMVSIATHQIFMFTYFAVVLLILLYDTYERKFSIPYLINVAVTFIATSFAYVYAQFISVNSKLKTIEEAYSFIKDRTNSFVHSDMINFEYYTTIGYHWTHIVLISWKRRIIVGGIILVLLIPLWILLGYIWKNALQKSTDKAQKFIFWLMIFSPLATLPVFIFAADWGRWFAAILIGQFCFILYLAFKKVKPMIFSLEMLQAHIQQNLFVYLLLILYLTVLGKFVDVRQLEIANSIYTVLDMVYHGIIGFVQKLIMKVF